VRCTADGFLSPGSFPVAALSSICHNSAVSKNMALHCQVWVTFAVRAVAGQGLKGVGCLGGDCCSGHCRHGYLPQADNTRCTRVVLQARADNMTKLSLLETAPQAAPDAVASAS
jgi:hypothetical protein